MKERVRKEVEEEEEESLTKQVIKQLWSYLLAMIVPVTILACVAPQKSFTYVIDSAYSKASMLLNMDMDRVWYITNDLVNKTTEMLQVEREAISQAIDQSRAFSTALRESSWLEIVEDNLYIALGAVAALTIALMLVPWNKLRRWVANIMWRTIVLFLSVLPLDNGLGHLSDEKGGDYEIFVVASAVAITLGVNYLLWCGTWWFLWQVQHEFIPRLWAAVRDSAKGSFRRKRSEIPIHKEITVAPKDSTTAKPKLANKEE